MDESIYDVLIIGAGPCGLAVATRLCERCPSALFTDDEQHRYHWIKRHSGRMAIKSHRNGTTREASLPTETKYATLVLDASGSDWLARWNKMFQMFEISHLRSPMFFHLDPRDRDSLLEFTHWSNRQDECREITGCVGKEKSKHRKKQDRRNARPREPPVNERDRKDYYTPSTKLFADQCQSLVDHYDLGHDLVKHEVVEDIDFENSSGNGNSGIFKVQTNKQVHKARVVVLAVGPGSQPTIPGVRPGQRVQGACHTMQINNFPDPTIASKIRQKQATNVIVIGGGLTAAQIADLAIRRGVCKVWLIMRGNLKVKPFDLSLEWLGKFRNTEHAAFWTEDCNDERLRYILEARGGGSITPQFRKVLDMHISTGKLRIMTHTTIESKAWDAKTTQWVVKTNPPVELPPADYIYYATGMQPNVRALPYFQTMQEKFPIDSYGGLPAVNDDLRWNDRVPLFVTGRLAALQLGPGAANLSGARSGAERIAWSVSAYLDKGAGRGEHDDHYSLGIGSRYAALA